MMDSKTMNRESRYNGYHAVSESGAAGPAGSQKHEKEEMRVNRKLKLLVCALTCVCLVLTGFAGCLGEAMAPEAGNATRTVMLYFCGSDLEESYALAT